MVAVTALVVMVVDNVLCAVAVACFDCISSTEIDTQVFFFNFL
jgi:hypothetical protein